jgi:osmoprotectant transport system permease protein
VNDRGAGTWQLDRLGTLLGLAAISSVLFLPFLEFKASRIASGHPRLLFEVLPTTAAMLVAVVLASVAALAIGLRNPRIRLATALLALGVTAFALGAAADLLTPAGNRLVRISPGGGFWVTAIAFGLLATDALARLRPGPGRRVVYLLIAAVVVYCAFAAGTFDHLSVMREYIVNASSFAREARRHLLLALGSVAVAAAAGLPIGIACHRIPTIRGSVLQVLNLIQTIPSIALFGLLMVPLAALAIAFPAIGDLGIHGIGPAPAAIALFLYALLPVVANTTLGLARVSPTTVDAARGMGLTDGQILTQIELPLAVPVIVTGIRIVLVQNIGLATVAALIGGGGFGTFVFQGVGQTAVDLVLLGAIPIVVMSFACAVVLDALVDSLSRTPA